MKKKLLITALVFISAFSAHAIRYQPNQLFRVYYYDQSQTQWAGHAILFCPTYANNSSGWEILDGEETPYYSEQVGQKCDTGPAAPLPCWAADPYACSP